jgi:putative membrane protein
MSLFRPPDRAVHAGPAAPHLARIHYPRVLLQLLWRMRIDLIVMAALCLLLQLLRLHVMDAALVRGGNQSTLGIAVAVFLAFRNTQAINRWWEARSLWGALVNQSRSWRDTVHTVIDASGGAETFPGRLLRLQLLLVWLVNLELRGYGVPALRDRVLMLAAGLGFDPAVTVQEICRERSRMLHQLFQQGAISDLGRDALVRSAVAFNDALGGLEKIRNTPIPPPYDAFVRLIAWLYGLELFINLEVNGQPLIGTLLFLGFLVAERLAAYVEGPFDRDPASFALPLNQICLTISHDLLAHDSPFADVPRCSDPSIWS